MSLDESVNIEAKGHTSFCSTSDSLNVTFEFKSVEVGTECPIPDRVVDESIKFDQESLTFVRVLNDSVEPAAKDSASVCATDESMKIDMEGVTSIHESVEGVTSVHESVEGVTSVHESVEGVTSIHESVEGVTSVHESVEGVTSVHESVEGVTSVHESVEGVTSVHESVEGVTSVHESVEGVTSVHESVEVCAGDLTSVDCTNESVGVQIDVGVPVDEEMRSKVENLTRELMAYKSEYATMHNRLKVLFRTSTDDHCHSHHTLTDPVTHKNSIQSKSYNSSW